MPRLASANRGPAILIAIGSGFVLVGTVPVAITLGFGVRTSATVIGVGFMGFGIMIMLPGICWCLAVQRRRIGLFCASRHTADSSPLQSTPAISKAPSSSKDDGTLDSLMTPVHERMHQSPQRLLHVDDSKNEWMEGWNEECVPMEGQSVFG